MYLTELRLHNFRNHASSLFQFGTGTNLLFGDNGQGKTNVLEAISYLCLTKSFYATSDTTVLRINTDFFEVEGVFLSDSRNENIVRVAYDKQSAQKAFFINKKSMEPFSSVVGRYPVVICSPEHNPITMGGPEERRKFIDLVISQANNVYFKSLMEYRKVLKQRNRILQDGKLQNKNVSALLEPWNEQFIQFGSSVIFRRDRFVSEFRNIHLKTYGFLIAGVEEPSLEYNPFSGSFSSEEECRNIFKSELSKSAKEEQRLGITTVGPHRDELGLKINGLDLRKYGSQGQHKTFLVSLKLAEVFYLKERCDETPLILLDDIFSELDEQRTQRLLEYVETMSQTFISSTSIRSFESFMRVADRNKNFFIRNGAIVEPEPGTAQ